MIYAIGGIKTRFTKDLDFLSKDKIKSQNKLQRIIRQIVSMPYPADGVDFDSQSIETETIATQNDYPGFRLHIEASLGNIKQRVINEFGFFEYYARAIAKYLLLLKIFTRFSCM